MSERIFLQYYSRLNFGDDLFVRILAEQFPNHRVCLLGNPAYIPKKLGSNVYLSPFSWAAVAIGVVQARVKGRVFSKLLQDLYDRSITFAQKGAAASVMIGGSIFMDKPNGQNEIRFDVEKNDERDFSVNSRILTGRSNFVIGANLGPAYSEGYFQNMKRRTESYAHICVRDYASYSELQDCPNVQYAPDVVFALSPIRRPVMEKKTVISVIDPSRHTKEPEVIESYYNLLAQAISHLSESGHKIVLVSFCKREGDEVGIARLCERCSSDACIEVYRYDGDLDGMIECFASASFVIASRFHSMILAAVCGKPMFPISYNCKTIHYLQDLCFLGTYATIDSLAEMQVSDILQNYENGYVCDCTAHHEHAGNQFWALREYLEGDV